MNSQIILNPFTRFSERPLLAVGVIMAVVGSFIATVCGVTYDGVIDVHSHPDTNFLNSIKENLLVILLLSFLLFALGRIINPKTRFVDILNSVLLFRIPFYVSALLISIPAMRNIEREISENLTSFDNISLQPIDLTVLLIVSILLIVFLIYSVILLFQGFKTATNAKKPAHYLSFAFVIILAELASKIILSIS
ncbi:YIP1 family protein [Flavobacterium sp.]